MTRGMRLTGCLMVAALAGTTFVGCNADRGPMPGHSRESTKRDPKKMPPAELQQFVSTNAAMAAADTAISLTQLPTSPLVAQLPDNSTPIVTMKPETPLSSRLIGIGRVAKPAETPNRTVPIHTATNVPERTTNSSLAVVKFSVRSETFYDNEKEAMNDAFKVAAKRIEEELFTHKPPIRVKLSNRKIYDDYIVRGSEKAIPLNPTEADAVKAAGLEGKYTHYGFDIEIGEHQIRSLRSEDRIVHVLPVVGGLLGICLVANILLRLTGAAASAVRRV